MIDIIRNLKLLPSIGEISRDCNFALLLSQADISVAYESSTCIVYLSLRCDI